MMVKVKIDATVLKNEVAQLFNLTLDARDAKSDLQRRDKVSIVLEKVRDLKDKLEKL